MSSLDHFQAPLDADMEKQRAELAAIIRQNTAEDGTYATAVGSLFMSRHSKSMSLPQYWRNPRCASWRRAVKRSGWPMNTSITIR